MVLICRKTEFCGNDRVSEIVLIGILLGLVELEKWNRIVTFSVKRVIKTLHCIVNNKNLN